MVEHSAANILLFGKVTTNLIQDMLLIAMLLSCRNRRQENKLYIFKNANMKTTTYMF